MMSINKTSRFEQICEGNSKDISGSRFYTVNVLKNKDFISILMIMIIILFNVPYQFSNIPKFNFFKIGKNIYMDFYIDLAPAPSV